MTHFLLIDSTKQEIISLKRITTVNEWLVQSHVVHLGHNIL